MKKTLSLLLASLALVAGVALVAPAAPAGASGGGATIRTGACSGNATWKLKAKVRDGRIEVEYEVDSNRAGQVWTYALRQNGNVIAQGRATTVAPSGSFSIERRAVNTPGADTFTGSATRVRDGQTCGGQLVF